MFLKYQILICISFLNIYLEAVNGAQPLINKTFLRLYMCGRLLFTLCCYHSGPFTDINKLWIDLILLLNCQSFHPVPGNMLIKLTGKFWGLFLSFFFFCLHLEQRLGLHFKFLSIFNYRSHGNGFTLQLSFCCPRWRWSRVRNCWRYRMQDNGWVTWKLGWDSRLWWCVFLQLCVNVPASVLVWQIRLILVGLGGNEEWWQCRSGRFVYVCMHVC